MRISHLNESPVLACAAGAAALLVAVASSGCDRCGAPPPIRKPAANYRLTMDEVLLEVAQRVPEFGGMFVDPDGVLNVFLLDTTRLAAVEDAIAQELGSDVLPVQGTKAVQGDFGFKQLFDWHEAHRTETLADPGVISVSIQEMTNRVKVRVDSAAARTRVEQILTTNGVPLDAAEIVLSAPFEFLQASIQDRSRPLIGGQRITRTGGGRCTLGFLAVRDRLAGLVTNSHCQVAQGGLLGTVWHQANAPGDGSDQVGAERIDPSYSGGGDCPSSLVCRRSDSAFIERSAAPGFAPPDARWDAIALPSNYSGGGMTMDTFVRVRSKQPHAICGESLQKIGQSSGSTTGTVTDTCCNVKGGGNFAFFCQTLLQIGNAPGDSGAPVFTWSSATLPQGAKPTATLYGLLWGGTSSGESAFSPINFIEAELGFLRTHRFEGGANSAPAAVILSPSDNATVGVGGLALETYEVGISDWEDGPGCCNVQWASDVDGAMGGGASLQYAFTTQGTRQVTVTVTDSAGASTMDSITVQTGNTPPIVSIAAPTNGQIVFNGAPVQLQGSGYDVNESFQQLPCQLLVWSSNNSADNWQPQSGCTAQVTFTTNGPRTITLTGTDSGALQHAAGVSINVVNAQAGSPPAVLIVAPTINSAYDRNATVMLTGRVTDLDGAGPISYEWVLTGLGGTALIGNAPQITVGSGTAQSGQNFSTAWVPANHVISNPGGAAVRIRLKGTDSDGTQTKTVQFTVMFPPA